MTNAERLANEEKLATMIMGWQRKEITNDLMEKWSVWVNKDGFGTGYYDCCTDPELNIFSYEPWNPYDNIEQALMLVDKIQSSNGWRFCLLGGDTTESGFFGWKAEFFGDYVSANNYGQRHGIAYAPTRAAAICDAIIKTLEEGE